MKNNSDVPVGVVWANIRVTNDHGEEIEKEDGAIVFLAEKGIRNRLEPGATWNGDSEWEAIPYLPMLDLQVQKPQHVKVEVDVVAAFSDRRLGPEKQVLGG